MPKPDDFDLIPRTPAARPPEQRDDYSGGQGGWQEGGSGGNGGRDWRWLAALISVAFLFFAIGAALFTLRERLGGDATPTPPPATATPSGTMSGFLATLVALGSPTSTPGTPTPTPSGTATPTPGVTPSPTPCASAPAPAFAAFYRQEVFGCALTSGSQIIWAAWEPFERGSMLWRSDTNRSYLFTLGGAWQVIDAAWDGQPPPSRGDPPPGLRAPERGFGWAWGTDDALFQALGWATDAEKGFCAEVQEFEQGFFLQSSPVASCTAENLYNHASAGDWRPLVIAAHDSGVWSGSLGGATVVAPAPTRTVEVAARPVSQGQFEAHPGAGIRLDGDLGDWPAAAWQPIDHVVQGASEYHGSPDAYGVFQVAWTPGGLMLAAQVQDDLFRPGPGGTEMWKGDALELQVDARLSEDYDDSAANGDDFQIGLGVGPDGALRQYRWLPYAQEGSLPSYGAGSGRDGGYRIEALLPWTTFDLGAVEAGASFGFNLSVSDNDADQPQQQSLLSASPARSTFDNPTQWGTLVILP